MRSLLLAVLILLSTAATAPAQWTQSSLTSSPEQEASAIQASFGTDGTAAIVWAETHWDSRPTSAHLAVRSPGRDFRAPIALGDVHEQRLSAAVAPDGTVATVRWGSADGLLYGTVAPGSNTVDWRPLPNTARGRMAKVAFDAAGTATVVWRPWDPPADGRPALLALTIAPDGTVPAPVTITNHYPSQWVLEVAPTGQAVVLLDSTATVYRSGPTGAWEAPTRLADPYWKILSPDIGFDTRGNLYAAMIGRPVMGGHEWAVRTAVRPAGGAWTTAPFDINGQEDLRLGVDPAGGAEPACDCEDGFYTRAATGFAAPPVRELDSVGYLSDYAIAPGGTRVALWSTGSREATIGTRSASGPWTFTPLPDPADSRRLAIGPTGDALVINTHFDANTTAQRLRVFSARIGAPSGGGGVPGGGDAAGGGASAGGGTAGAAGAANGGGADAASGGHAGAANGGGGASASALGAGGVVVAIVRAGVRARGLRLAESVRRLNELVTGTELTDMATMCVLAVTHDSDDVRVVSAGHPAPVLIPAAGEPRLAVERHGVVLGVVGATYAESTFVFAPGID